MNDAAPSPSAVTASRDVRAVINRLRRRVLNASEAGDVTLSQESVLIRLFDMGRVTASDLAAAEGVKHQSITATISSLSEAGLVSRTPDPGDGRRLLITLTAAGRRRVETGRQVRTEWLADRLQARCSESERQQVIAAMAILQRLTDD